VSTGNRIGRYTLLGQLATGGMAEVFLARQEGLEGFAKIVVVKRILPHMAQDAEFIEMFLNEARLVARINHANVVSVSELGKDDETGAYFMVMEYIDGCNLKRLAHAAARAGSPLSPAICARIVADACAGLDFAHDLRDENQQPLNLIHRDITPENLLITYTDGMVKVVDFGIARVGAIAGHTKPGKVKGKYSYVAPEQFRGLPLDRRVDVWGLGVTLYWLLSGTRPFHGDTEEALIHQVLLDDPLPLHQADEAIPQRLSEIVQRALQKAPDARYPTAGALQADLESWLASTPSQMSRSELGRLVGGYFPEDVDEERLKRRALIAGQPPPASLPGSAPLGIGTHQLEPTGSSMGISFKGGLGRDRRPATIAAGAAVVLAVGGLLWLGGKRPKAPPTQHPSEVAAQLPLQAQAAEPAKPAPVPPAPPPTTETAPPEPSPAPAVAPRTPVKRSTGRLAVLVAPWAKVYVDGQEKGTTPFAPLEMKAGRHHVLLVNDEIHASREMTVEVRAGRTATVRIKLE
jgi:serine/threonine-protein kinase